MSSNGKQMQILGISSSEENYQLIPIQYSFQIILFALEIKYIKNMVSPYPRNTLKKYIHSYELQIIPQISSS